MRSVIRAVAAAACLVLALPAHAQQAWPTRPVRVIVPFSLGGATDLVARILGPALAESLGQPFVIENRPGASGNIGVEIVAKAAPDGQTLLVGNISTNAINPSGFAGRLKFDPVKDLAPVTLVASVPTLLVTSPNLPPNSVRELIEYARARPGELNYSNPFGSYSHMDTLDLASRTGVKVVLIPSKGGRMKALATTSRERLAELPNVPMMAEAGFPGIGSENWNGLFFPAQTPRPVVNRLFAATMDAIRKTTVREAFANASMPVSTSKSPEDFQAFVDAEVRRWATIIREHHVQIE